MAHRPSLLSHAQVIGTIGERCMSGSNLNGGYYDGNGDNAPAYGDHNTADHDPNLFPVDPISAEEAAMIAQSADLTPSCSSQCYWCTGEEGEIVAQLGEDWPDFIVQGTYGGSSPMTADLISEAEARGVPIIKLHQIWASGDYSQGFIEITQRFEELANFLGATADLSDDKASLCTEVNTFKATAAAAAERGVRAMGTFTPWGDATDGVVAGWLYGPGWPQVLNMLEELGMQLLHPTDPPDSLDAANFPYPVDFWLYDVRVALDFTSEAFAAAWPHPAVVAKQYAYWPNGGHVHSYQHAIDILRLVGEALGNANRIEDATECTEVADVTSADYRASGLTNGEYACPQPVDYDWCAAPTRHFIDDDGTRFSTHLAAPTVVALADDALGLHDMGVASAQIHGTMKERHMGGSNFGGYHGYNFFGTNPGNEEYNPDLFPASPHTPEEMSLIAAAFDMTPSCSSANAYCPDTPGEIVGQLNEHGWPDYIIRGPYAFNLPDDVYGNATAHHTQIIHISPNAADGTPLGFIEISNRFEELATFLGATADLSDQKEALCHEVNKFKATAAAAATRGVRAMATFMPWGTITEGQATGWFFGRDQVLNMLEELGMQLLHQNSSGFARFVGTPADVPYPVDFWLYDARITFDFTADAFAEAWPHPALVAKQYAYWPITGQMHSYQHAIDILRLVGEALGNANRIEDATPCTEVADVTSADYRINGLPWKQYACPKPVDYDWCAVHATPSPVPAPTPAPVPAPVVPDDNDNDNGPTQNDVASAGGGAAAAGVVVGLAAGGVLGVLYAKKTNAAPMEQKAYDVSTDRV